MFLSGCHFQGNYNHPCLQLVGLLRCSHFYRLRSRRSSIVCDYGIPASYPDGLLPVEPLSVEPLLVFSHLLAHVEVHSRAQSKDQGCGPVLYLSGLFQTLSSALQPQLGAHLQADELLYQDFSGPYQFRPTGEPGFYSRRVSWCLSCS